MSPIFLPKKFLGVDIGTATIKVVELSSWAGRVKLENYGEIPASAMYQKPFRTFKKSTLLLSSDEISRAIKAVVDEAKIKTKKCIFSIPDFSSFFTTIELPQMTAEELPQAITTEARKHVPIPLAESAVDWQVIEGKVGDKKINKLRILLVAVPTETINQYQKIAVSAGLELLALEAEVFGLVRSLVDREEKRTVALIDIGARTTTCSIIEKRVLRSSHSFDVSGSALTERIVEGLSIDYKMAEKIRDKYGILPMAIGLDGMSVGEILIPLVDLIIAENEKVLKNYAWKEGKSIEKIILAGGTAFLPGLLEYFRDYFKIEVEVANPFKKILYPPIIERILKEELGPSYAIAVGMALRGFE